MEALVALTEVLRQQPRERRFGQVVTVRGQLIEVAGFGQAAPLGARLSVLADGRAIDLEVTGLTADRLQCLSFADPRGVAAGARVELASRQVALRPCAAWLGRVVDGLGRPVDGGGPLPQGLVAQAVRAAPPPAAERSRVGERVATGVRALDLFAPLCRGQRLGLFAGSGVGKSVLMAQLARWTDCDVAVIGLVGERGRELRDFVEEELGPEGRARSVVVVATSDEPALMRRQAAWATLAIAEHFRDAGAHVLCVMDSVTRFAMAQREIGLASGEPPATKGYTPTVFAELPRLLERAGPGRAGQGSITGLFTVLVDGDDHDEPIADAARGILDGHIVMSRRIAERGRYPAIDVLRSVSRTLPACLSPDQNKLRLAARDLLSVHGDMEELVRLGAYRQGSNPDVDRAIALSPAIERLLHQDRSDLGPARDGFPDLANLLGSAS
ncbi:flagellar protein export ATPase FliI [Sphingomonas sp. KRR8]|uniref:flagellar protein export ATPase FliI n=1 Tax=Sphingomonas sp. KRR8 TaxID=2942996 RepID=UPI00201FE5E4|nr:flagellar protein export ATPase FliI [Sphingomonas sp. KRR8]URD61389.1 flagellar protein export ATPase FliI [Sphingomonas sp. KRR8]